MADREIPSGDWMIRMQSGDSKLFKRAKMLVEELDALTSGRSASYPTAVIMHSALVALIKETETHLAKARLDKPMAKKA